MRWEVEEFLKLACDGKLVTPQNKAKWIILGRYARLSNIMLQFNSMCLRHAGHSDVRVQGKKGKDKEN